MKIAHVITRFGLGGAEENTFKSCVHQQASGHDVYVIYGPDSKPEHYQAINKKIHYLEVPSLVQPIRPIKEFRAIAELCGVIRTIGPDVVHTHTSKAGILGRLAARLSGVRHIVHGVHILPFINVNPAEQALYLFLERWMAQFTDLFVHVSEGTKSAYDKNRIGLEIPHAVVRSGMEISHFQCANWPENWRSILRIGPNDAKPFVLLMMAALDKRKRHMDFLEGFAKATKNGDFIRLLLAGEGPERPSIEAQIHRLGLDDRVVLLGHHSEPEGLVSLSDLGVLASHREGLPRVVIQYLAGNRPVVVSPIEAIEEVVKDGENGIVVRSTRAQDVAFAAVAVTSDARRLKALQVGAANTDVEAWASRSMFQALDNSYALMPSFRSTPSIQRQPHHSPSSTSETRL